MTDIPITAEWLNPQDHNTGATERGATERGATERGATERGATERGATEKLKNRHESVNEQLWRGELSVGEVIALLEKMPLDGKLRIYGNKLQVISPADNKVYTLDRVR